MGFTYIYAFSLNDAQNIISNSDPNYQAKSPIAVFEARTADVADKRRTPWHLISPALPVAAAKIIWTRNKCRPNPMVVCLENFRAASGEMIQREYRWRDWQHNDEARCFVRDSSSIAITTGIRYAAPWIRDTKTAWAH